ncbi:MAG TPA: glycosyltransferase family 2 protein, partial [Pyrinomonadaceae bacterium]
MNPLYSVVVPARNQGEPLPLLMRCLEAQTLAPDKFECVVVDDASTDGTGAFLRGYRAGFELRTVTNRQGRGRSLSRDRGWRDARGEFVVFLDADMLPEPGWLEAFDRAFTGGGFDIVAGGRYHVTVDEGRGLAPQLAELAGRDVDELFAGEDPEGARALRARARPGQYAHPIFGQLEGQLPPLGLAYPKSLLNAYSFNAANTAVRRSYLERSTGFNPYLLRFEDIELGIRLWELGARFGGAEGARAYHLSRREPAEPWFDYAEGRALFCRHPYRLVALMNLWGSYQSSGGSDAPPGCFDSLLNLLRSDGEGLPFDLCEEYMRVYRQPLPVDFHVSKEAMVNFYTAGNPLWTRESAAGVFDLAVEHGLFVGRKGSEVYFDFMHTGNWVRDCTSSLQDWLTKYILTGTKSPFLLSLKHSDLLSLRCVGKYEVTFPSEWFEGEGAQATLNLPLPVEHASQTGVKITRCFPESLSAYVGRSRGMVIGFPVGRGEGDLVRVGYEFECRVDEFAPPERSTPPRETPDLSRHLRPAMPAPYLAKAEALLRHVIPEGVTDPFETARALYVWLQHSVVFNETPFSYP